MPPAPGIPVPREAAVSDAPSAVPAGRRHQPAELPAASVGGARARGPLADVYGPTARAGPPRSAPGRLPAGGDTLGAAAPCVPSSRSDDRLAAAGHGVPAVVAGLRQGSAGAA